MKKIKSVSHLLFLLFKTLTYGLPLVTTYFILFHFESMLNWGGWHSLLSTPVKDPSHFSLLHRFIILLIEALPLSINVLICHQLAKLFRLYEHGYLFEEENIRLIKNISIYLISGELIQLLYQPLITAALTFTNPSGQRIASITLGTANLSTLITAFIILIASWIIKEAHKLKTDALLTI
ncbi:TPA: DUF2975 domain-containing protein [Legionella pneumophila]|nr:DUF2975 domain-containing protein [Legionella pneumophila]